MSVQINGSDGRIISTHADHSGNVSIGGTLTYEDVTNVDSVGLITARSGIKVTSGDIAMDTAGNITLGDSGGATDDRIVLGAGSDLSIYHDGTNNWIKTTGVQGAIYLESSTNLNLRVNSGETAILATADGAVELYHNNNKKLETYGTGIIITGNSNVTGNADHPDNSKARFGTSNDLEIYHNGTNSKITNSTGTLYIEGTTEIWNSAGSETLAKFITDGAVELYHNNERKIFTKTNGAQVEDTTAAGAYLTIATSAGSQGSLYGTSNTLGFLDNQNHYMLKGVKDGAVELFYDNDKVFQTVDYGIQVADNTRVYENSSHNIGIVRHADMHHAIIFRATSNADGTSLTNENTTTFREYGAFQFMTGAINMTTKLIIYQNGNIGAPSGSNIYNASDLRLKKNVVTLDKGLETIKSIRPISFNWIDGFCDDEKDTLYGFVAQEVQTVDPNLVCPFGAEGLNIKIGEDQENPDQVIENPLRVNEKFVVPMLVKSVQELSAEVDALKSEIAALKSN